MQLQSLAIPFLALTLSAWAGDEHPALELARSKRYSVLYAGSEERARELSRVLEEAFSEFDEYLGRAPKTKALPLELRVYADREHWLEGIEGDGIVLPDGIDTLWFELQSGVIYAYEQGTPWLTRAFALHGAFQQFHYAARSKDRDLAHTWYVLGLAEHLSIHRWNGRRLTLGADPVVCWKDMPALALDDLGALRTSLSRLAEDDCNDAVISWALVSFLSSGVDKRRQKRFRKLALGLQGSKMTGEQFAHSLGDPAEFSRELEEWLAGTQIPWEPVQGDWEDIGGGELVVRPNGATAVALLKHRPDRVRVEVRAEPLARFGFILGWEDAANHTRVEVETHWLKVLRVRDGDPVVVDDLAIERRDSRILKLERTEDGADLISVGRDAELVVEAGEGKRGLWIYNGDARFLDLEWR